MITESVFTVLQRQALILTQALLGVISPNFRMVSLAIESEISKVTIILEKDFEDDREEIEDLKTEFEALQPICTDYDFKVKITNETLDWPDSSSIVVYRRREL